MDAVELNYPVGVAAAAVGASKLVGSERVGRDRVAVFGVEPLVKPARGLRDAGEGSSVNALISAPWNNGPTIEVCKKNNEASNNHRDDLSKHLFSSETSSPSWLLKCDEVKVNRKAGRVSKGGSGSAKRPRTSLVEDAAGLTGIDDTKDLLDKTQFARQRNNSSSRRGDRRNSKISPKAKYDPFSVKGSFPSFSSTAGANNFSVLYGLKTDVHDIADLVDDLSLNDLLSGTYQCRSLGKEKGKKPANSTECLLQSLRKACSILQVPKPFPTQNATVIDNSLNDTTGICPPNSLPRSVSGNTAETTPTDLSSSDKDSCSNPESSAQLLDFQFDQPKDTLQGLALGPSKDLESLLQDAGKPAASSRSTAPDPRPGQQLASLASLPPFPWSQNFGGHCRAYSDSAKLLTSRSTCQGRWAKIDNCIRCIGAPSTSFTNLESLAYDEALVPSSGPKPESDYRSAAASMSCTCNHSLSTTLTSLTSQVSSESGGDMKTIGKAEHCPKLVAAAQTLVDIAAHGSKSLINHEKTMKWPKQPSQKAMKACKLKSNEKHDLFIASTSLVVGLVASDRMIRGGTMDQVMPSKRPKLSTVESKRYPDHINGSIRKGSSLLWSTPKSSRSSSSKPLEDSITGSRHSAAYVLQKTCMMPPPAKALGRSCGSSSQPKVRLMSFLLSFDPESGERGFLWKSTDSLSEVKVVGAAVMWPRKEQE
ncbi:unnamed protein product [Linum trigynum]|uniref:Uncharacterized protein n=1 Tax=Linum trigynum TaxID=586398 RepID=A0AAV2DNI7_9ROSI